MKIERCLLRENYIDKVICKLVTLTEPKSYLSDTHFNQSYLITTPLTYDYLSYTNFVLSLHTRQMHQANYSDYRQISIIRRIKSPIKCFLSCLAVVFARSIEAKCYRERRCSWSSADRRCSNYIWVTNNFIAHWGATYIKDFAVVIKFHIYVYIHHDNCNSETGFAFIFRITVVQSASCLNIQQSFS